MARYVYRCDKCDEVFEVYHKMSEKIDTCIKCSGEVYKVPGKFFSLKEETAGGVVKQKIAEFAEDLKNQKRERMKDNYVE